MKLQFALLLLSGLLAGRAGADRSAGGSGSATQPRWLSREREKLKRGINASEWFAQVYDKRGYTPEHFQAWTTADDIALIKSMGFDHVRLSVNPQPMFNEREPNKIPAEYLGVSRCGGEDDPRSWAGGRDRPASGERLQGAAGEGRRLCRALRRFLAGAGRALFDVGCGPRVSGNSE